MCKSESRQRSALAAVTLLTGIVLLGSSGCTAVQGVRDYVAYNDRHNDFVLSWRNSAWAQNAWFVRKEQFVGQPYLDHFGAGFRAGYADVAGGANGCTPALPPRRYWSWKYQTPEGQGKVAAWFAGYPHGAKAAEEDGAGNYSQIQVSQTMLSEYQLGHEPPYNTPLYLHDPAAWCREHGEMVGPGMAPEYAPLENGETPPAEFPMHRTPVPNGGEPLLYDPQARTTRWTQGTSSVSPASFQQPIVAGQETYGTRLLQP